MSFNACEFAVFRDADIAAGNTCQPNKKHILKDLSLNIL